ncbi:MAG TPA: 16S rRNA (uracil(1498)-N(3))-methyltransferase [Xanthomonadaceae bacterium]|nr:16S rRNA (uracil(1498)-N(3))-methyltransferase [Xanthomonadaceae bacterium]
MRVTRLYVDAALEPGARLRLPDAAAAHLVRVLRAHEGDVCVLFNGDGGDYAARIGAIGRREVLVEVGVRSDIDNESPLRIELLQGIARGEKMDLVLQKATELGIAAVRPVSSERSEVRLDPERAEKRLSHWQQVVASACEQSGRARLPEVSPPASLAAALTELPPDALRLTLALDGAQSLSQLEPTTHVLLAAGPEGGWSPRDRELLDAAGFIGLRFGPRVLRTETAGIAAIAGLQACWGDLR